MRPTCVHLVRACLLANSCFTNDDAYVVSGSEDGRIHFWSLVEGELVHTLGGGLDAAEGKSGARESALDEGEGEVEMGMGYAQARVGHTRAVTSIDYHPGKEVCLVSASHDGSVRCWK
jgi:WD40 repeat protein